MIFFRKGKAVLLSMLLIALECIAIMIGAVRTLGSIVGDKSASVYDISVDDSEHFISDGIKNTKFSVEGIKERIGNIFSRDEVQEKKEVKETDESKNNRWIDEDEWYIVSQLREEYRVDGIDIDWRQIDYGEEFDYPDHNYIYFDQRENMYVADWDISSNCIEKTGKVTNLWFDLFDFYNDNSITDVEFCTMFFQGAQYYAYKLYDMAELEEIGNIEDEQYKEVPNLIGLSLEDAGNLLLEKGLDMGLPEYDNSELYPPNVVIYQSIEAGTYVPEGEMIYVTLNRGMNKENENDNAAISKITYDDTKICGLAADYYEKHNGARPPCVRIDSYDGDFVTIHLYEAMTDHDATWDWYYVNRITGETTDFEGAKFNIFEDTIVNKVDKSEDDADKEEKDVVITKDTFGSDDSIYTVQIGWNVISIEDGAFSKLVNLKEISVDTRNPYYASYGGCLYNKDFSQLICIPQNTTSVQIKSSVTSYTPHALDGLDQSRIDKMNDLINGQ